MKKINIIFLTLMNFIIFCFFVFFINNYSRSIVNNLYKNLNNPLQLDKLIMNLNKQFVGISGISFLFGIIVIVVIYLITKKQKNWI